LETQPPQLTDVWARGTVYEPYMGRWSRLVAREFLAWLDVPPESRWLDIGCGTGALTQTILQVASPREITGVDPSDGYITYARAKVDDVRVRFQVAGAQALPFESAHYDVGVAGLSLNFMPQPDLALAEVMRVTRPGGTVAAYVWDYGGQMPMLRVFWDAAGALDPVARDLDEGKRFPLCQPGPLSALFENGKLHEVHVRAIDAPMQFRDFDDYWSPFLGGEGPAPSYVRALSEEQRQRLRESLRARLPVGQDGSISLVARAWAVRGRV
jgi:SAM-dependent methyltransferase